MALRREVHSLACEIFVTTSVEHEVGNVEKCLAEGFDEVVLLALNRGTLAKVRRAVEARVGEKDRERLHFMSPEEFFTFLDVPPEPVEEMTVSGHKVKVKYRPATGEAAARKSKSVSEILLRT